MKKLLILFWVLLGVVLITMGLVTVSHRYMYPKSPIAKGESEIHHQITVLSYNTHRMGGFQKTEKNEVLRFLRSCSADIVCLQEVEIYHDELYLTEEEMLQAFAAYPYFYLGYSIRNYRRNFGNVVFSKYPLIHAHQVDYTSRSNSSLVVDVCVGNDTIRLISNHLESNRIERRDIDSLVQTKSIHSGDLEEKLKRTNALRHEQAGVVHGEVEESPYPVILVGDFNAIPFSITYFLMRRGLQDCFLKCSNGQIGSTMSYLHLPLRIDYIFCSEELTPWGFCVEETPGSDHYPIRATLVW